ncbi:acyltransferase family protein [Microbacterium sp. NPDC055683]
MTETNAPQTNATETKATGTARPTFEFADGIRAVAALCVALLHATTFTGRAGDVEEALPFVARVAELGHYAVPVFIVLSGFVLMIPAARGDGYRLRGGFGRYIGRRARRILPPYYASLALFLLLIALVPLLQHRAGTAWDNKIPVTVGGVVSHLLLVHNVSPAWIYQINGPAWSVATEWQIYFLLPLVLLPLCRWITPWGMLAIALALGPALTLLVPRTASASFWFIGLFALGMIAALLTVRGSRIAPAWFGWAALTGILAGAGWMLVDPPTSLLARIAADTLVGAAVAAGLVALGRSSIDGRTTPVRRVFEWRPLVGTGTWSYSIYLIHSPLLGLANLLLLPLALPTAVHWLIMVLGALPIALGISYLFFQLVERHFTTSHQRRELATGSRASDGPPPSGVA